MNEVSGFANASDVEAQNALNALSTGLVKVLHASADGVFPLAGYTVASARATFASSYNIDRKSTRLNSSHIPLSRMPSSA